MDSGGYFIAESAASLLYCIIYIVNLCVSVKAQMPVGGPVDVSTCGKKISSAG